MGRAKEYANAAERQAAYRARHREKEPPLQGELAGLARSLHGQLVTAVDEGRCPVPAELIVRRADETLRNLIFYLRRSGETEKDGVSARPRKEGRAGETRD